jgi:hypothetical protein
MRELMFKYFSDTPFGVSDAFHIESFNIWHFLYIFLIFGGILAAALILRNKSTETKEKALRTLAFILIFSYITDYFVHDFVYANFNEATGEYVRAGLNMDKLPFHICTAMGIIIVFTTFNEKLHRFYEPIAALAIVAPMMYLVYPSTGVGGEFWCYRVVQTMFFHGIEMAWGVLAVTTSKTSLRWKNIWKAEILLILITLWAKLGATMLEYNWFFLISNPFGIAALDKPWLLPIITPTAIFIIVVAIYGIASGIKALIKKQEEKKIA